MIILFKVATFLIGVADLCILVEGIPSEPRALLPNEFGRLYDRRNPPLVSVFQVLSCPRNSTPAVTGNNNNAHRNFSLSPTDDVIGVDAASSAYFLLLSMSDGSSYISSQLELQCISPTGGSSEVLEVRAFDSLVSPYLLEAPEDPIRVSDALSVGSVVYQLKFGIGPCTPFAVSVEVSELTANVPFVVENGTNGSEWHLVVSRPLQSGLYDVLTVAYCNGQANSPATYAYHKISIEAGSKVIAATLGNVLGLLLLVLLATGTLEL